MSLSFKEAALVAFAAALFIMGVVTAPAAPPPQLDPLSKECIGCHDGAAGPDVRVDLRNNPTGRGSHVHSFDGEHPIGMIYQSYVDTKPGYKPISVQERNMIMVNGAVGCLTCHDPLNPAKGHLIKSDKNSALCLTCHDK
ncbi:cytochrome c3 family protein [Geomonas subterranea]|uniref:Cytochrome c3 family protein n=1 Tax=Geomonas subterranea TaxID=2847989 RepID=A0ABX8LCN1_9BACT|nr:cytochrome c3 family protein [Geomonas subterranea]QXE89796.1 cytochrome c3 family protein [Geomonas subterranea]QXM08086.1 cytochrome c3 family protein [Geomonas subterranea]